MKTFKSSILVQSTHLLGLSNSIFLWDVTHFHFEIKGSFPSFLFNWLMYLHSLVFLFLYYLLYIYVYVLSSIHISWISSYQPLGLSNAWAMKTSHEKSYVVDAMKIPCTRLQKISSFKLLGVNFISALYAWYIFILVTRYIDYIGINAYNFIHHYTPFYILPVCF